MGKYLNRSSREQWNEGRNNDAWLSSSLILGYIAMVGVLETEVAEIGSGPFSTLALTNLPG